ncbi:MAG: hypothetical protein HC930_14725 [Hydrococcus sp. SU_1_0]|nr:hypothetical protein [Hydrococcus sp. SU_1_0]
MVATKERDKIESPKIYQAIGLVYGKVVVGEESSSLEIDGERFKLVCPRFRLLKLKDYLEINPDASLYLKVYPRFHPFKQEFSFQLVNFYPEQPKQTPVNQFLLAGVWQYLPLLPDIPVLTIYRNKLHNSESKSTFRQNHLPVTDFDEKPYRHQSKDSTDPTKRKFYEMVVRFDVSQKEFQFVFLLDSTEKLPYRVYKKFKKKKKSSRSKKVELTAMDFASLQKTAAKLRRIGFFRVQNCG